MSEIVKFNCDKFTIIRDDPRFLVCKFFFGLIGSNYNGSVIEKEDYENNKNFIGYTPICGKFKNGDFKEHEIDEYPLGSILSLEDCEYGYEIYENLEYATALGVIQKEYLTKEAENILKSGTKKISIEIEVLKKEKLSSGKFRFKEWIYQCITILGDKLEIATGMKNAHLEVLNKPREAYASFCKSTIETFAKQDTDNKFQLGDSVIPTELHMPEHEGKTGIISEVKNGYYYAIKFIGDEEQHEWYAEDELKIFKNEEFSVGIELGKSNSIEIKNDKDNSAAGDWEDPGAKMLNSLLKASNHASLIKEAYLIIDENVDNDLSVNNVHYPHHIINDGNLVVHYRGIQSALSRARAQGITGSPISHLKKHYKQLGLNMDNFEKFNLTKEDYSYLFEDINNFKESEVDKVVFNKEEFAKNFNAVANEMWGNIVNASEIKAEDLKAFAKEILTEEFNSFAKIKVDEKNVEFIQEKETLQSTFESEKETIKAEFITKSEEFTTQLAEFTTQLEEKQNSIVSLGQELDGLKEQYSAKETEIETFKSEVETYKTENEILKTDIVNFAKEKKETQAEIILSKFAKKINEDERKDLFGKLEKFNTVEEFEKEVKAFVCDKYEAETKGKKDFASYSRMGIVVTNETKPEGEHWTDYVKDYQEKN